MHSVVNGATVALAQGRSFASALEACLAELDSRVSKGLEELSSSCPAVSSSGALGGICRTRWLKGPEWSSTVCSSPRRSTAQRGPPVRSTLTEPIGPW